MQRFREVVLDSAGAPMSGVTITVKDAKTGTNATLYSDNGVTSLANPFSNDTNGSFEFYAANGRYTIELSKTGATFIAADTTDIVLFDPADAGASQLNYCVNPSFEIWGAGTSAAPTGWTLTGAGATVAKNTTAGQFKVGAASAALTRAGTDCYLAQSPDTFADFGPVGWWQGKTVGLGCWVRATVASRARLAINDGVGTTYSAYHTGGSALEWLSVARKIDGSATKVEIRLVVDTGDTTAQFDGATLFVGLLPVDYAPSGWRGRRLVVHAHEGDSTFTNGTRYTSGWAGSATESVGFTSQTVPFACVASRLYVRVGTAPGAGQSGVVTLRKNGATDTALTVTLVTGVTGSDLTNQVALAAGDVWTIKEVWSAGAPACGGAAYSVLFEEIP